MHGPQIEPLELAWRVASGQFDDSLLAVLSRGFAAFVNAGGDLSLERCLRIPRGSARFRVAQRNYWLAEVARATDGISSQWGLAVAISKELNTFITCGAWRAWKELQDPPTGTSTLRTGLFYAAKFNDGKSLSSKQVSRVIGHIYQLPMSMNQGHALPHADMAEQH